MSSLTWPLNRLYVAVVNKCITLFIWIHFAMSERIVYNTVSIYIWKGFNMVRSNSMRKAVFTWSKMYLFFMHQIKSTFTHYVLSLALVALQMQWPTQNSTKLSNNLPRTIHYEYCLHWFFISLASSLIHIPYISALIISSSRMAF